MCQIYIYIALGLIFLWKTTISQVCGLSLSLSLSLMACAHTHTHPDTCTHTHARTHTHTHTHTHAHTRTHTHTETITQIKKTKYKYSTHWKPVQTHPGTEERQHRWRHHTRWDLLTDRRHWVSQSVLSAAGSSAPGRTAGSPCSCPGSWTSGWSGTGALWHIKAAINLLSLQMGAFAHMHQDVKYLNSCKEKVKYKKKKKKNDKPSIADNC